ncbi:phosphotransferase family protein, partial [Marinobacter sp. 1Y8]
PKPNKDQYLADKIHSFRAQLDLLQATNPILEYAISWMTDNLPSIDELVLVHGDFRTGNIMIENNHISGILDWEFTQWGDRREDIGWFTAKCWRFGQNKNIAGGIGSYEDFSQAYTDVCSADVPKTELKFWHILSHVRWAIIAMQQSNRNDDMEIPSLELALTEFMVPKLEKNILDILGDKV